MNANERYIYSLEEQLEKAKAEIKELQQSRQAAVSGSLRLEEIAKELWHDGKMIKAIQIIQALNRIELKEAKQYCDKWGRNDH